MKKKMQSNGRIRGGKTIKTLSIATDNSVPSKWTIDRIFGEENVDFNYASREEFEKKLRSMSSGELRDFAAQRGLNVIDIQEKMEYERAIANLLAQYDEYMANVKLAGQAPPTVYPPGTDDAVKSILNG